MRKYLLISILFLAASCSNYNKLLKSTDWDKKSEAANKYYNKKDYVRAIPLYEELLSHYRGKKESEQIYYYYSYSHFGMRDYALAGYHFKNFTETFPSSQYKEECFYMYAYCYYLESLPYNLDQTDSRNAVRELQLFINLYPESKYVAQCNELIDKLREKLQKKAYHSAKLFYHLEDYRAAVVSFKNVLKDFPDIAEREELEFLIVKSSYLYAKNSVESKKEERFESTVEEFRDFLETNPSSSYLNEARDVYEKSMKELSKIQENKSKFKNQ